MTSGRMRPRPCDTHVWCDVHGEIHRAEPDVYGEGLPECARPNWRKVYVLGEAGERF